MSELSTRERVATERPAALPKPFDAHRDFIQRHGQRLAVYLSMPQCHAGNAHLRPLVLLHSINAAASSAEVRPIFQRYAAERPVLALDLPGFGASDRRPAQYTPRLMSDCVSAAIGYLGELGFHRPVDLLAVSLSCEIAARVASVDPAAVRSLALVSPTGFESSVPERYDDGRTKDKPWLRWLLESGPWSKALFRRLTSEKSMRKFLERTWGSEQIDEALLAYNLITVAPLGARHAPYAFLGGALFTRGVAHLYAQLKQPVWMIHGRKGEFAKVPGLAGFVPSRPWVIESVDTGAMPYFERLPEFASRYGAFLNALDAGAR